MYIDIEKMILSEIEVGWTSIFPKIVNIRCSTTFNTLTFSKREKVLKIIKYQYNFSLPSKCSVLLRVIFIEL